MTILIFLCVACDPTTTINIPLDRKSISMTFPCTPVIQHKKNNDPEINSFILYYCNNSDNKVYLLTQTKFSNKSFDNFTQSEFLEYKSDRLAHEGFPEKLMSMDKITSHEIEFYKIKKRYFNPSRFLEFSVFLVDKSLFHATYGDMIDTFSDTESNFFLDSVKVTDDKIY
jgi:hypothetical protein